MSRQARKTQKETSNKLAEAAGSIQDSGLPERIMSGSAMIQNGYYETLKPREDYIRNGLEALNRQLESARRSIGQTQAGKLEEAASRARQLSEGLESMQQRMGQAQTQPQRQGQNRAGQSQSAEGQGERQPQGGQSARGATGQNPQVGTSGSNPDAAGAPAGIGARRNEEERQSNSELRQRLADAQQLRPLLDRNSTQMQNLDKVIDSLRRAGDYTNDGSPEQMARLKSALDYMQKVEFDLARDLERLNQRDQYFFAEDNEAPSDYQKLVEEYYKSIAKR
jgi:hypothetical protein